MYVSNKTNKSSNQLLLYLIHSTMSRSVALLLLLLMVRFTEPCSERNSNLTMAINSAIDLLSKAKKDIPSCSEEARMTGALDCSDLYERGFNKSGIYPIWPINRLSKNRRLDVYCDMSEGGGWTVINKKSPLGRYKQYFDKDWAAYKKGFGNVDTENFCIGNDNTFMLTNQRKYIARVYQRYIQSKKYFIADCEFWIDDEFNNYTLHISDCSGHLGKGVLKHNEMKFSTKDKDNDPVPYMNCAEKRKYGSWFPSCPPYKTPHITRIHLEAWTGIKIRPSSYLKFERLVMS